MTKAVDKILTGAGTIVHSLVIPLFFLIFTMYYKPAGAYDLLEMAHVSYAFNVTNMTLRGHHAKTFVQVFCYRFSFVWRLYNHQIFAHIYKV